MAPGRYSESETRKTIGRVFMGIVRAGCIDGRENKFVARKLG